MATASITNTRRLEGELISRGLVPDGCRLLEVRIEPHSALVIRYEVFVRNDQFAKFAEALTAAAAEGIADDERNRAALAKK